MPRLSNSADSLHGVNLVRSNARKAAHGEVFTPGWLVESMLDLVRDESYRIESRFLEPACGAGNFLVPILERKLTAVRKRYGRSDFEHRHYALLAVMSLYGIELLADNVNECRENLLEAFLSHVPRGDNEVWHAAARTVVTTNIVHGDALTMMTRQDDPQPITFAEWSYLGRGRYQRRDFRYTTLAQLSSFGEDTLMGQANPGDLFAPHRVYPRLTVADIGALISADD